MFYPNQGISKMVKQVNRSIAVIFAAVFGTVVETQPVDTARSITVLIETDDITEPNWEDKTDEITASLGIRG